MAPLLWIFVARVVRPLAVLARAMHQTAARIHAEKDLAMARDAAQAANALKGDKARDLGAGMDGHVSKPIAADAPRHGIKGLLSEEPPENWPLDGRWMAGVRKTAGASIKVSAMSHVFKRLGLAAPIFQAPMAGVQNHRLALAVCQAGGLGALPAAMLSPEALLAELQALTAATGSPYNVNFFCHTPPTPSPEAQMRWQQALAPYYREFGLDPSQMARGPGRVPFAHDSADVLEAFRPAVVSFHFGLPAPDLLARVKSWGSLVVSSATTVDEARWLQAHGADLVIAQGLEAGGHLGMFLTNDLSTPIGTMALLPQIVQAVDVPVIAAGGVGSDQSVAAAKLLGAAGVQIGTAYLCSHEASTSAVHRAALQSPAAQHTALTTLFSGRPARGIVNRLMRELGPLNAAVPAFPLATAAIAPLRAAAEAQGLSDFTPLWSGQNASNARSLSATDITRGFVQAWLKTSMHQEG